MTESPIKLPQATQSLKDMREAMDSGIPTESTVQVLRDLAKKVKELDEESRESLGAIRAAGRSELEAKRTALILIGSTLRRIRELDIG